MFTGSAILIMGQLSDMLLLVGLGAVMGKNTKHKKGKSKKFSDFSGFKEYGISSFASLFWQVFCEYFLTVWGN